MYQKLTHLSQCIRNVHHNVHKLYNVKPYRYCWYGVTLQHSVRAGLWRLTKNNNRMLHAVHLSNAHNMYCIRYAHKVKFREVYYIPCT